MRRNYFDLLSFDSTHYNNKQQDGYTNQALLENTVHKYHHVSTQECIKISIKISMKIE